MFTWIDLLVIIAVIIYIVDGYRQGFIKQFFDLIGIILSFIIALKFYNVIGTLLGTWGLSSNLTKPVGFFILWAVVQIIFYIGGYYLFKFLPNRFHYNSVNKAFGLLAGLIKGTIIVSIFLILLMVLPVGSSIKLKLSNSFVTGHLIKATASVEGQVSTALWQMNNSLGFLGQVSNTEGSDLGFKTNNYQINENEEKDMIDKVNAERKKVGAPLLQEDTLLRNVARAHSMDMVIKGYFAHTDPSGATPSDRLSMAGADFRLAGENLALAPSVDLAFIGLMKSPKHRDNIINPSFHRIGVGVLDLGQYGKIFTQVFTD